LVGPETGTAPHSGSLIPPCRMTWSPPWAGRR
jgi:hypothetical protein